MRLWFSNKVTPVTGSPLGPGTACLKQLEEAQSLFYKSYPSINISGTNVVNTLRSESAATREWILTALRSTTGQDRIFAMAYLVNAYPFLSLRYLDTLINLIAPSKQRDCSRAIEVTHQLFARSLLPSQRALVQFDLRPDCQPAKCASAEHRVETLCLWFFEDQLKSKYLRFIKALERLLMSDTMESFKRKALNALSDLAVRSPENREMILGIIVNKLGDRSKVLASSVIHRLRTIVKKRYDLSTAIVQEVRSFIFRPNLPERAKYYAVAFLSCLQLRKSSTDSTKDNTEQDLPVALVKVYAAFFNATMKIELPEKLVAALLTGLNRAAPFVSESRLGEVLVEIDNIFRLVHRSSFNISLQALAVLLQLSLCRVNIRDRYYQALYRKLRDPEILHTSRGPSILHLLYRSMLADPENERLCAFTQRLLQLCLLHPNPGFVVGTLILLAKVQAAKKQVLVLQQVPVKVQLNSENMQSKESLSSSFTELGMGGDDEEHFSDAPESEDDDNEPRTTTTNGPTTLSSEPVVASWDHKELSKSKKTDQHNGAPPGQSYRPDAREPLFARAGSQPSWPLVLLACHSHPTVALFANNLIQQKSVLYTGNPFDDFSLAHFLDRFAYKKPKPNAKSKNRAPPGRVLQRKTGVSSGSRALPVNSTLFRQLSLDRVAADEQFFHNYFTFLKSRVGKSEKDQSGSEGESDDSISDDEFDAYLEKYERGLIPTGDELEDEGADQEFDEADFSAGSDEDLNADSGDELQFEAMDGFDASRIDKKKKTSKPPTSESDDESLMDFDDDDGALDDIEEYEEEDDSDDDDGFKVKKKHKSSNLADLFASADEVGHLYGARETEKERRQRVWEEKRAIDPSRPSGRFNRKRAHPGKSKKHQQQHVQLKQKGSKRKRHA